LFATECPDDAPEGKTFLDNINPSSLEIVRGARLEPSLAGAQPGQHFQFERLGYFFVDPAASKPGRPVFNRTATLRDTWAKEAAKGQAQ
jgi:glutaminyl-tRNA synthetase